MSVRIHTIALALALCTPVMAEQGFSSAYKAYQDAVAANDHQAQLTTARAAFEAGKTKFGESHINTANLAMNYARAIGLNQYVDGITPTDAEYPGEIELLQFAVSVYEQEYGENDPQLIEPLLALAKSLQAHKSEPEIRTAVVRAIKLAGDEPVLIQARVKYDAAVILQKTVDYKSLAKRYMFDAYDLYLEHAPQNSLDRNLTAFHIAKYHMAERRLSKAEDLLLGVIKEFQALDHSSQVELSAHAFLVEIYERQGEREAATEHCLAIGSMKPWSGAQEETPLFRTAPEYPKSAAQRGKDGMVRMQLIVDKMGFVKEPEILLSKGGKSFERSALETIKKWRYAPRFENGEPVDAVTTVQMDYRIHR